MPVGLVTCEFALDADHDEPAISIGADRTIQRYFIHSQPAIGRTKRSSLRPGARPLNARSGGGNRVK